MSQTFWESEVEETPSRANQPAKHSSEQLAEPEALALSADDFSALEERIRRAVELVKRERQARVAAEERAAKAEELLTGQNPVVDKLKEEVRALRAERDHVRQRVERLLQQLDALEL